MRARSGWFSGSVRQHLGHAGGDPAVAASPEVLHVGSVEEEAVGLLQLVEIGDHLLRVAVEILLVAGGAIGLELQHGEHVHVVDPVARLGGEAVGLRVLPLAVGEGSCRRRDTSGLWSGWRSPAARRRRSSRRRGGAVGMRSASAPPGISGSNLLISSCAQSVVVRELGKAQRAVPGADLGVVNGLGVLVRTGDEVLGELLAHLLRGRRPQASW